MAQRLKTQGVMRYAGHEMGASINGIDPAAERAVSSIAGDFGGQLRLASTPEATTSWSATAWPSGSAPRSATR